MKEGAEGWKVGERFEKKENGKEKGEVNKKKKKC